MTSTTPSTPSSGWLGLGLFSATLATLLLETLDARLLSVLTWYHLSFLAVSLAMLGMAAGAVYVFVRPARFAFDQAPVTLARVSLMFAWSIPASHLVTLVVPFLPLTTASVMEVAGIGVFTVALGVPFVLSGVTVTVALTRCRGPIGRLYAYDLIGAALGCLAVVPLLEWSNVSSAVLVSGAIAAIAAMSFARFAGRRPMVPLVTAGLLTALALANTGSGQMFQILYPKNRQLWLQNSLNDVARWNSHSYVIVHKPGEGPAFHWGPGIGAEQFKAEIAWLAIDGEAGSPFTRWDGRAESLEWVSYDVTSLPYYLRRGGKVGIIGVGGGRDILSALWARSRSVTAVEVNRIMIDLLTGSHRQFAGIADRPEVTLVHDDGRAFMTRTSQSFDVMQISLVDTWASTGAGAFSLSENGLYTLEAWRVFLSRLSPGGILSVSRWFDPRNVSETSRLVSLGTAALIDRGVARPSDHLVLGVRDRIATLMISTAPFTTADREALEQVSTEKGFTLAVSPWAPAAGGPVIDRIAQSTTMSALAAATADPLYDYSPPTDARPYYFNMLKLSALWSGAELPKDGALGGNLRATLLLTVLLGITSALVLLIIGYPLVTAGRPPMPTARFAWTMGYFGVIGWAFMLIQIGFLQRFAVYLGHPTYTLAVVLFSMLLATGVGSLLSERLGVSGRLRLLPLGIAGALAVIAVGVPPLLASTMASSIAVRTAVVLGVTAPLSVLLGMCFPIGVRLVEDAPLVVAWAWGVNGAFSVLASILAVILSIWIGIDANFWVAGALYAGLAVPLGVMLKVGR